MSASSSVARPALIRDPRDIPVVGTDGHLPALPLAALTPEALRHAFSAELAGGEPLQPVPGLIAGDGAAWAGAAGRVPAAASVLIGLVPREAGLHVLLTRRTDHLRDHGGQISFPGGRQEPEDADVAATALREAQEEIGLEAQWVELLGRLPVYTTISRFVVTPVLALVHPAHCLQPDPAEVAMAFEVPLAFLMNPAHHCRHRWEADGQSREFLAMPWQAPDGQEFYIWGATAAMLRNLYHQLAHRLAHQPTVAGLSG